MGFIASLLGAKLVLKSPNSVFDETAWRLVKNATTKILYHLSFVKYSALENKTLLKIKHH